MVIWHHELSPAAEHGLVPDASFMDHWTDIDAERLARYETMFAWSAVAEDFYAPADIREGHVAVDFGCGPGHAAIEFARRVGPAGHVHAFDINAEFIRRARQKAKAAGLAGRITAQRLTGDDLPLAASSVDRITARNTIIYVDDPLHTFAEFRRALRPGGIAHAIESDWSLTAVEPLGAEWRALVDAARWAWRTPEIGRRLHGIARRAGFQQVTVQVLTRPDTDGRLMDMIRTVADYARESDTMDADRIDVALARLERGLAAGTYLAVAPQFLVTARA
jgi:ubiquinone/menaquinone biosynthesis C-methylase UbiE